MEPLVEAADAFELARARAAGARLVGVNARDLHTFRVSVDAACAVLREGAQVEGGERLILLGLSGVSSRGDVVRYARAGAHGALVGEHLMRVRSPARAIADLLGRPRPPLVKICGVCTAGDALTAARAGADIIGLIFAPASKRALTLEDARPIVDAVRSIAAKSASVSTTALTAASSASPARLLEAAADERPLLCGVFAGQSATAAADIAHELRLDIVQFSGGRAEEECSFASAPAPPLAVFRAAHVRDGNAPAALSHEPSGPIMLLDSYAPEGGGAGVTFDWARVARTRLPSDFVLAGGLTPANVGGGVRALRPFAVDVCSGVEARAREKDPTKIDAFVRAATAAQERPSVLSIVAALVDGRRPSPHDIASCVTEGVSGSVAGGTIASFLTALAMRPDVQHDPAVLLACRRVLLERALDVRVPRDGGADVLDIVGTGGDGADTFNVSTAAALVVAAVAHARGGAGLVVAKHGNRSSAGRCGAADFMEAVFSAAVLAPGAAQRTLDAFGYGFLFAPAFHPALAAVRAARREVGVRTVFNLLGPLVSPARPSIMLLGVSRAELGPIFAELLRASPEVRAALVVHGADDGVDELSPSGRTLAWLVRAGAPVRALELRPTEDFGLGEHALAAVAGGTPAANAARWAALLLAGGASSDPPLCDYVCLSAGAAIHLAGLAPDFRAGATVAREAIESGAVGRFSELIKERVGSAT
jgi:anthranilate phosphoribosyltransferase